MARTKPASITMHLSIKEERACGCSIVNSKVYTTRDETGKMLKITARSREV
jgi:hypothetical protein